MREQERLEKEEEECLAKEAKLARLEKIRRQEEAAAIVRHRKAQLAEWTSSEDVYKRDNPSSEEEG